MGMYIGPQEWWFKKKDRSLRFNSADSAYLSRTPSTAGNRKTWTWAGWVKRSNISGEVPLFFSTGNTDSTFFRIYIQSTHDLVVSTFNSSTVGLRTIQKLRDPSAWMHIQVALDTTQATDSDRIKVYVNGSKLEVSDFDLTNWPSLNGEYGINESGRSHYIGRRDSGTNYANAYLAEVHFIDGQALEPTSFGEFDSDDVWQSKTYTGTYGQNGFYLNFNDNTSTSTLGKDVSGQSNDWTANNFSITEGAGNDSVVDSPFSYGVDTGAGGEVVGNYCTLNPLAKGPNTTISNGNLEQSTSASGGSLLGTFGMSSGKWYWEASNLASGNSGGYGIALSDISLADYPGSQSNAWSYFYDGKKYNNGTGTSYGSTFASGDVIGVAFDADNGTLTFYKNGTSQGTAFTGLTSGPYLPALGGSSSYSVANFGQRPFIYSAPSGFKALCTTNLPDSTITKGSDYMDVALYTGNGTSQTISGLGFSPDWVWLKKRSGLADHYLYDQVRGATYRLYSNTTDAESTSATGLTAFTSDGFSLGSANDVNQSSNTYAAWCWDGGSSTVSNTDGSITSSVRANTTAGFSIVTASPAQTANSIGHGLGAEPYLIISKSRTVTYDWNVYHKDLGTGQFLRLNTTATAQSSSGYWGTVNSTTFGVATGNNANNSGDMVYYCFAPVEGYSAFGSYTGNGSSDGPFVYTGFRPRWVLYKAATGSAYYWGIYDTERDKSNICSANLAPNASDGEGSYSYLDILSNGFKPRAAGNLNESGSTYIYAAFAENPFKKSRAR